jgi:transcriptional regulator with XRE-family HTH domain
VDVVSLAVLADTSPGFRPDAFRYDRWGCALQYRFPMSKLIDFESNWEELEQSANVFALVVMAQLKAKRVKDGVARKDAKVAIIRLMYERGYSKQQILELFNVIDWMIQLPSSLNEDFLNTIYAIEEDKNMPYINTAERVGLEKGRHEGELIGIQKGEQIGIKKGEQIGILRNQRETALTLLELKFGALPDWATEMIRQADATKLDAWTRGVLTAESLEALLGKH